MKDLSYSTDPAHDFPSDVQTATGTPPEQAFMFFLEGYSDQIFVNVASNSYALLKTTEAGPANLKYPSLTCDGTYEDLGSVSFADVVLLDATTIRHERSHKNSEVDSEEGAYKIQKEALEKIGPDAFKNKKFYDYNLRRFDKNSKTAP